MVYNSIYKTEVGDKMDKETFISFIKDYTKSKLLTVMMDRNYLLRENSINPVVCINEGYYTFIHNYFYYIIKSMLNHKLKTKDNSIVLPFYQHPKKENIHKYFVGVSNNKTTINAHTFIENHPNIFIRKENNNYILPIFYKKEEISLFLGQNLEVEKEIQLLNEQAKYLFDNLYGEKKQQFERRITNKYRQLQINHSISLLDILNELINYKEE